MSAYGSEPRPVPASGARALDAKRLWAGGIATALVAALVAMVGMLVATVAFDVNPVVPGWLLGDGSDADRTTRFAVTALVAGLLATALMHLLIATTPRPHAFFSWIVVLATVAAAVTPFASDGDLSEQIATSLIALGVGIVIGSLLSTVASAASNAR